MTMKMMKLFLSMFFAFAVADTASAIEDLRITIQNTTNIALSWPSQAGETYIIEHRADLQPGTPWTMLTNSMPPASDTNRTKYVVIGVVPPPSQGGGGGGSGDPPPSPGSASSGGGTTEAKPGDKKPKEYQPLPPVPWDESTWAQGTNFSGGASPMDAGEDGSLAASIEWSGQGFRSWAWRTIRRLAAAFPSNWKWELTLPLENCLGSVSRTRTRIESPA